MPVEIERKFLVQNSEWREFVIARSKISQGYLLSVPGKSVRIRLKDERAFLTAKLGTHALSRNEIEFEIPTEAASELLELACDDEVIRKERHVVPADDGLKWEIDVFSGNLEGLILAEIELPQVDHEFPVPTWLGMEVTNDRAFLNENLRCLDRTDLENLLRKTGTAAQEF